jgi:hypothetical protein
LGKNLPKTLQVSFKNALFANLLMILPKMSLLKVDNALLKVFRKILGRFWKIKSLNLFQLERLLEADLDKFER